MDKLMSNWKTRLNVAVWHEETNVHLYFWTGLYYLKSSFNLASITLLIPGWLLQRVVKAQTRSPALLLSLGRIFSIA